MRIFPIIALLMWAVTTSTAFFPDLSGCQSNTLALLLSGLGISEVPAAAFARFSALQSLCVPLPTPCPACQLMPLLSVRRDLSGNAITALARGAFFGLGNLTFLFVRAVRALAGLRANVSQST
jgi:hypothetical protein